jgi:hypothetical protein
MADYKKVNDAKGITRTDVILRVADNAYIPVDEQNRDYSEYLKWIEAGNTPDDAESAPIGSRRDKALADLLAKRDEEVYKNVSLGGKLYYADGPSQNLINQALSSQERGITGIFPADWLLADGTKQSVTYDELKAVNGVIATRIATDYANYYDLYVAISGSDSPDTVDISQGWAD